MTSQSSLSSDPDPQLHFPFSLHPLARPFAVPAQLFISTQKQADPKILYSYVAVGAVVFDSFSSPNPRVLLIQRAASDSMPNRWEVPGGGCDDDDATILHSAARELEEEAGLVATQIGPWVKCAHGTNVFKSRSGKVVGKFDFLVSANTKDAGTEEDVVKLNPEEHQKHLWATSEEVSARRVGDVELKFTTKATEEIILEAFRMVGAMSKEDWP